MNMKQLNKIATAIIPNDGGELTLFRREEEFSIRLSGVRGELMNSRVFNSEQELSKLGCAHIRNKDNAEVLVGGLGMGYTLATALETGHSGRTYSRSCGMEPRAAR